MRDNNRTPTDVCGEASCSLDLLILREVLNSLMVTFFLFRGYSDSVLLGVDLDIGSISGALSGN